MKTIVLDGGPCGGKTTAQARLETHFSDLGFKIFWRREAAADLINSGIKPQDYKDFQKAVLDHMRFWDQKIRLAAKAYDPEKIIIFKDRGIMSGAAYMEAKQFDQLLKRRVTNRIKAWNDGEGVIFLRSAAVGAPQHYVNTPTRKEPIEDVAALDERTLQAWMGHPHVIVIDNSTDFETKMRRTIAAACRILGLPEPVEIERKYLVMSVHALELPVESHSVHIDQIYLNNDSRIRRRGHDGYYSYYHTVKKPTQNSDTRIELDRKITHREFEDLLVRSASKNHVPIYKIRTCFVWHNQYFELDNFQSPNRADLIPAGDDRLAELEVELTDRQQTVSLPPFINVVADVTEDKRYSNEAIARKEKTR